MTIQVDKEAKIRAQGLRFSLCSFQTIVAFIVTKNVLDVVKLLTLKLQKRDKILDAHTILDTMPLGVSSSPEQS